MNGIFLGLSDQKQAKSPIPTNLKIRILRLK